MLYVLFDLGTSLLLFLAMLIALRWGVRIGRRSRAENGDEEIGSGPVDGAIYALLGLLVAFTFSGAASRFDERRDLIVEEANDIGTAWLRVDLLPTDAQPKLRQMMRDYTAARVEAYRLLPDVAASGTQLAKAQALQTAIWQEAVAASREPGQDTAAAMLLLPALNAMFDITTTREMAAKKHPPNSIYALLFAIGVVTAVLAGFNMGRGGPVSRLHMLAFPLIVTAVVYLILDLEHPRLGLITVTEFDQVIANVLAGMNTPGG